MFGTQVVKFRVTVPEEASHEAESPEALSEPLPELQPARAMVETTAAAAIVRTRDLFMLIPIEVRDRGARSRVGTTLLPWGRDDEEARCGSSGPGRLT
jgi:hypothetical protein